MDSLIGTGSVHPTDNLSLAGPGGAALNTLQPELRDPKAAKKRAGEEDLVAQRLVNLEVDQAGMKDLEQDVIVLQGEVTNLSNKVNPLAAITELVWRKRTAEELGDGQGGVDLDNIMRA